MSDPQFQSERFGVKMNKVLALALVIPVVMISVTAYVHSGWYQTPAKSAQATTQASPSPIGYAGVIKSGSHHRALVSVDHQLQFAQVGQRIDSVWRVEDFDDHELILIADDGRSFIVSRDELVSTFPAQAKDTQ